MNMKTKKSCPCEVYILMVEIDKSNKKACWVTINA